MSTDNVALQVFQGAGKIGIGILVIMATVVTIATLPVWGPFWCLYRLGDSFYREGICGGVPRSSRKYIKGKP